MDSALIMAVAIFFIVVRSCLFSRSPTHSDLRKEPGEPAKVQFSFFWGQRTKNPSAQTMSSSNSLGSNEVTV